MLACTIGVQFCMSLWASDLLASRDLLSAGATTAVWSGLLLGIAVSLRGSRLTRHYPPDTVLNAALVSNWSGLGSSGHKDCSEDEWDAVRETTRRGLSHGDYIKITGKYGTVIAVPLTTRDGKIMGVVALDAPVGFHAQLSNSKVSEAVALTAMLIRNLLE